MCGYKLPISWQNLANKGLAQAKLLLIAFRGLLFLAHPVHEPHNETYHGTWCNTAVRFSCHFKKFGLFT